MCQFGSISIAYYRSVTLRPLVSHVLHSFKAEKFFSQSLKAEYLAGTVIKLSTSTSVNTSAPVIPPVLNVDFSQHQPFA